MEESKKQPEANLILRYAEAEHLLKALNLIPTENRQTVTHAGLEKKLTTIRDYWLKLERDRKAKQVTILKRKTIKK